MNEVEKLKNISLKTNFTVDRVLRWLQILGSDVILRQFLKEYNEKLIKMIYDIVNIQYNGNSTHIIEKSIVSLYKGKAKE